MAYTTIDDPSAFFHTRLYSGNNSGSGLAITNNANAGDFQPDWVWVKRRDSAGSSGLHDSSRGSTKRIKSDGNDEEDTNSNILASFNSNGFTIGDNSGNYNASGTYVAWQWKINGGSRTTFNEVGNNPAGGYQVNTTAGISIVDYTGTGGNGDTAHGLGAKPNVMLQKKLGGAASWVVYHDKVASDPATDYLILNETSAVGDYATHFNDTEPTSTEFTLGTDGAVNSDGVTNVMYLFTEIKGFSKFGKYTGNSAADGTFVYTGFKPAWVMTKAIFSQGDSNNYNFWTIVDNTRTPNNNISLNSALFANSSNAEGVRYSGTGSGIAHMDLLSNGFKLRGSSYETNQAGTYVYLAFAEHPFVSSKGVPVTAR